MIGPFNTYAPPRVYTSTIAQNTVPTLLGGIRVPVLIGPAQESISQTNFEMIRGSSSVADTPIFGEDVTGQWIVGGTAQNPTLGNQNGNLFQFRVRNFPIVDGSGRGLVTYDSTKVSVSVNGQQVVASAVNGATGIITILVPPQPTDVVSVNYYFHRGDTRITDDVSSQVSSGIAALVAPKAEPYSITTGTSDTLVITLNDSTQYSIVLTPGASRVASDVANNINAAAIPGFTASVHIDADNLNHLQLSANGNILIGNGNADGAFGFSPGDYTSRVTTFRVFQGPIVDGSGGGITTTDPSKVTVLVNGTQVLASAVDGKNRYVTLSSAPFDGSTITITYWFNTFQDTFDYLPNSNILNVVNVGIAPGRADYIQGADYIVVNEGSQSIIQWGTAFAISAGTTTGSVAFDSTKIVGMLVDNRMFGALCTRYTDPTTSTVSVTQFLLPLSPTTGNGRDTPLSQSLFTTITNGRQDLATVRPDLVIAYVGKTWADALAHPPVKVLSVDSTTNTITLQKPVPADYNVYATFWYNVIDDDQFTFTVVTPGPSGTGTYTITDQATGSNLFGVTFGVKSGLAQVVQWPSGDEQIPDAFHTGGGKAVSETVTVTFSNALATHASFTNANPEPYDIYNHTRTFGTVDVDGNTFSADLGVFYDAMLLGQPVADPFPAIAASTYLQLVIDKVTLVVVPLAGLTTVAGVAGAINTVVDADAQVHPDGSGTFHSTLANDLATVVPYGTGFNILAIQGRKTASAALTATNGLISSVLVLPPTGAGQIDGSYAVGLAPNKASYGSYDAINQPATLVGTVSAAYSITAGVNDSFQINVDGVDVTTTIPTSGLLADAVTAINAAATIAFGGLTTIAYAGAGINANKLQLISTTNTVSSAIAIKTSGTANVVLGFTPGATVQRLQPTAAAIATSLNFSSVFNPWAVAYAIPVQGLGSYLEINSQTTGSGSTISFASTVDTTFITDTNIGIVPGVSGAIGEAAQSMFTVTSSSASGSAGTGYPGQTYTDAGTGLRFTVLPVVGGYTPAGYFTLLVNQTFTTNASIPIFAVHGVELIVYNTYNMGINTTALVNTYALTTGAEPAIGDVYYISYNYEKSDLTTALYRDSRLILQAFGAPTTDNPLALAARITQLNGAVLVGLKQVLRAPGTSQASASDYMAAIDEQRKPIAGQTNQDVIVPLTTDPTVFSYLNQHAIFMGAPRQEAERIGIVGTATGTSPLGVSAIAQGLSSALMVVTYPDSYVIGVQDAQGNTTNQLVDGSYMAAAIAGVMTNPAFDVATPLTRRNVLGFLQLGHLLDPTEANQVAVNGVTIIEQVSTGMRVRHGLTTDMSSVITRTPSVTVTIQYVQQQVRAALDPFIGQKLTGTIVKSVETAMVGTFANLIDKQIVSSVAGIEVMVSPTDPTSLQTSAVYIPVFPLEYIVCVLSIRVSS